VVGAQSTIGGGGRYDQLAEQLGGRPTPGVGFASGIERIILEMKDQDVALPPSADLCAFLVYRDEGGKSIAFRLAETLRTSGISADMSFGDRALRKQFGAADKARAHYAVVVGDDDSVELKDLRDGGDQRRVAVSDLVAVLRGERGATE